MGNIEGVGLVCDRLCKGHSAESVLNGEYYFGVSMKCTFSDHAFWLGWHSVALAQLSKAEPTKPRTLVEVNTTVGESTVFKGPREAPRLLVMSTV